MTTMTRGAYALPGTTLDYHTGSWRVQRPEHRHRAAPCHHACPAGEDAQAWLALIAEGNRRAAWEKLIEANPLPAITGRVCHHPCESACNRSQYDEAIAIHACERVLGDEAIANNWRYPVDAPSGNAPVVAIVGAGPAGLSCAWHLLRHGIKSVLFDELPQAGGTLGTAIPAYRLPRDLLAAETGRLLELSGIDFRPLHRLGRDISLDQLRQEYAGVFLAPGNQRSREWSVDGVTPRDLHVGLDLLKEWVSVGDVPPMTSAAIVGGGNTAVDLARALKRAGVAQVHVITHQTLPRDHVRGDDAMSAIVREIRQAEEEGVTFHDQRGIRRLMLRGERVVGVEMVRMKKMVRANGRMERVAFEGTETVLHVDQVIPAIGQEVEPFGMEPLLHGQGAFEVDHWGVVSGHSGLYAGGDARGGHGTVTAAIGDGRRAALALVRHIRGEAPPKERLEEVIEIGQLNLHYYEHADRAQEPLLAVGERGLDNEIEGSIETTGADREAARCFSCGNCLACDNCWTLCPDSAVLKTTELARDGSHYRFDYDYCKGCGLCAHECPCGYIAMGEEV